MREQEQMREREREQEQKSNAVQVPSDVLASPTPAPTDCVDQTHSIPKKPKASKEKRPSPSRRYDGSGHTRIKTDTRQRCKNEGCKFKSFIVCEKCNVHLCVKKRNCFDLFHTVAHNI